MATLSSVTPYATIAEADAILGDDEPWNSATDIAKMAALVQATKYIQFNYNCGVYGPGFEDKNLEVLDSIKDGCALLANEDLSVDIFSRSESLGSLKSTEVKAGPVTSKKSYAVIDKASSRDIFPRITAILSPDCLLHNNGIKQLAVGRR